jgi:plastocyanin
MPRSRKRLSLAIAAGLLLVLGACGDNSDDTAGGTGTDATPVTVVATDFAFDTATIEADSGETIELTLQNDGEAPHTFSSDDIDVNVETDPGTTATGTFTVPDEAGTYEFHCEVHPDQMMGEIVVGGGDAGSTGDTTDTSDETDTTEDDTTEGSSENDDGY